MAQRLAPGLVIPLPAQDGIGRDYATGTTTVPAPRHKDGDQYYSRQQRRFSPKHPEPRLTSPPAAPQLGIEQARLHARQRRRVWYRGRPLSLRVELCQDALEPLCARRQRVPVAINCRTHQAHDFGIFFGSKIGRGH